MCIAFSMTQIMYTLRHHNQTIEFEYNSLILHKGYIGALKYDGTMHTFLIPYIDVFVYMDINNNKYVQMDIIASQ